ncbi:MAG: ATP-binding protein [Saprospiraceae bacterium]|jgi:predicted AAA+ superfamily ATPase|nr:ATP-binding protein [Saprospiraceae bacterium]HMT72225.1 AAA family ATPase [Saprospiraceae bacterium]
MVKKYDMSNVAIDNLIEISRRRIENVETHFLRELYRDVEWKSRLILLKGCRGVGKTYMMLQRLKSSDEESVYLSLDNIYFLTNILSTTIDTLYKKGYRLFGLDEVHKYPNWSLEIKNIYDNYPDIKLIITSSSALDIMAGQGDLSRRMDEYRMRGMSFSEFLSFEYSEMLPTYSLEELLENHSEIYDAYFEKLDLGRKFNIYLKKGYYPYYKESGIKYHDRLQSVILQVIDSDMAAIFKIDYESARQIKKMLALISKIVPFSPNVSKLSRDLAMSRNSVLTYLDYLSEADIIYGLKSTSKSDSSLTKPDKIYFENTNLLYAFDVASVNTGTIRETFVMNTLSRNGLVSTPTKGDFMIDEKYVIEVGGANKSFHQLAGMPNAILVKEGIIRGGKGIIPMWLLSLLKTKKY